VTAAFKEWAIVIDALARGEQIFILRKGGLHEGRRGFQMEHSEFALFPTLFHQQRDSVIPSAQIRYDEISPFFPPPNILRLEYWAKVVEHHSLDSFDHVRRLSSQHIWREELLADRFEWGREQSIYAIVVRIYRLPLKIELPMVPEYGGCKSWVTLAHSVTRAECEPVIDDATFQSRLARFHNAIQ
jgi:hypothetical protein